MRTCGLIVSILSLLLPGISAAQTQDSSKKYATGTSLLARAMSATTGGAAIQDIVLTGTVRHIAGSTDENGRVELKALASGETSIEMSFPSGNLKEIHAFRGRQPLGQWSGTDQRPHAISEHNLLVDSAWFSPALVLQRASTSPERVVVGEAASGQHSRDHIRVSRKPISGQGPTSGQAVNSLTKRVLDAIQMAPQIDFYLDPVTNLPVEMVFNTHPDNNLGENIPVRVTYSDYRAVNGVQAPFHLQKFMNGTLVLDVELETANLNSGLIPSSFVVTEEAPRRAAQ